MTFILLVNIHLCRYLKTVIPDLKPRRADTLEIRLFGCWEASVSVYEQQLNDIYTICNVMPPVESGVMSIIKHINISGAKIMNRYTAGDK